MIGFFVETVLHIECYQSIVESCQREGLTCCYVLNDNRKGESEWERMIESLKSVVASGVLGNSDYRWFSELKSEGKVFEVLVSPYYMAVNAPLARKHVRLMYGLAKDRWNYAWWNSQYDAILTYGTEDTARFDFYQTAYPVGNCRWDQILRDVESVQQKDSDKTKKSLLYAPTYGELSSIDAWLSEIELLGHEFKLYIKPHHGTLFKESERARLQRIKDSGITILSSLQEMVKVLPEIDVIISDGSGMVFDALLLKKPLIQCQIGFEANALATPTSTEYCLEEYAYPLKDPSQLRECLEEVLNRGFDQVHEEMRDYFFAYKDGYSGDRAMKVLKKMVDWDISEESLKSARDQRRSQVFRKLYGSR